MNLITETFVLEMRTSLNCFYVKVSNAFPIHFLKNDEDINQSLHQYSFLFHIIFEMNVTTKKYVMFLISSF